MCILTGILTGIVFAVDTPRVRQSLQTKIQEEIQEIKSKKHLGKFVEIQSLISYRRFSYSTLKPYWQASYHAATRTRHHYKICTTEILQYLLGYQEVLDQINDLLSGFLRLVWDPKRFLEIPRKFLEISRNFLNILGTS